MANEELGFDVIVNTAKGEAGLEKIGRSSSEAALKIDKANIQVEKSVLKLAQAEEKYGKASLQARDAANKLATAQQGLDKQLKGTADSADEATEGVKGFGDALKLAGGAAAAAALGAAVSKALDIEAGVDKMQGQLGATVKDAERYGKIAGQVYSGAYGDSLDQVNEAIVEVTRNIGKLGDSGSSSLQNVTQDALNLVSAFGVDLPEVTAAAGKLLKTGLAANAEEAFDLITAGLQRIPEAGDDLLDTLDEYSVQFKALGISGDQALAFISAAMQGGARDTDLAADALKEFNLRAKDLTNTTAQKAIEDLGLSSKRTAEAIASGGGSAVSATAQLLEKLRAIPDPAERSRLATALLGTQAEDLQSALFAVDPAKFVAGMDGVAGSAERLNATLGDNGAAKIEHYKRQLELLAANAAGVDGPLGVASAGVVAFGGSAISGASDVAQLAGGLALIPGVGAKVKQAGTAISGVLSGIGSSAKASRGSILSATTVLVGYAVAMEGLAAVAPQAEDAALGIGEAALQLSKLSSSSADAGKLGKNFENLGGFMRQIADPSLQDRFGDGVAGIAKVFSLGAVGSFDGSDGRREVLADLKSIDSALTGLVKSGKADQAADQFKALNEQAIAGGAGVDQLAKHLPGYTDAVAEAGSVSGSTVVQVKDLAHGMESQGQSAASAAKDQDELNKSLTDYANTLLGLRGDQRSFEEAIDAASASVKTNGKTLDITTEKGRANQAALDGIASAGLKLAEQTPKGANAQKHFADTIATTRARLIAAAEKMGQTKKQANQLATAILGVPSSKNIRIKDNIAAAESRLRSLASRIRGIPDGRYTVTEILLSENRRDAATANRGRRAAGGPVTANVPYIVGERGEELFVPHQSGYILPEGKKPGAPNRAPQAAGRLVRQQNPWHNNAPPTAKVTIVPDGSKASKLIVAVLREAIREQGGDVQKVLGALR